MDIQLLVNATGGRATPGASTGAAKGQDTPGDFARNLAEAAKVHQGRSDEAPRNAVEATSRPGGSPSQPLGTARNAAEQPGGQVRHRAGQNAVPSAASAQASKVLQPPPGADQLSGLALSPATPGMPAVDTAAAGLAEGDGAKVLAGSGKEAEVNAALMARQDDTERSTGDAWDAVQERLALIEQASRVDTDQRDDVPLVAQGGAASQELGSLTLRQAIAADALARTSPRQPVAGQLDPAAGGAPAVETASRATAVSIDALTQRSVVAPQNAPLAASGDLPAHGGGVELASQGQGVSNATSSAMPSATPNATPPGNPASIPALVTSPAWPQQLGQQLVRLSQRGGEQRVELQLHPAELGPLSVSLKMSDHGAQAQFISAHASVRQVLEQAIPQLREALAEQGISLGETSVGEQRGGNGDGEAAPQRPGSVLAAGLGEGDDGLPAESVGTMAGERKMEGRVDLYA